MTIGAVVVLFNPDDAVASNIMTYLPQLEVLYLIDNSDKPTFNIEVLSKEKATIHYIKNCTNEGIAKALNTALLYSQRDGLDYLLTMDQDSAFKDNDFSHYINHLKKNKENDIAMFSVNFQPKIFTDKSEPFFVESTITSGAILNLSLCKNIGQFDENLFIDLVDLEYCFRINRNNYRILLFPDIELDHNLGYTVYGRSLLTWKKTPRILHNPIRLYYIFRNSLYLLNKIKPTEKEKKEIWNCLKLIKNNLLYHDQKKKVIHFLVKAYKDYKRNRMGKIIL